MKGSQRLLNLDGSTPRMASALPEMPMEETMMARLLHISLFGMGNFFENMFRELGFTENSFHVMCLLISAKGGSGSPSDLSEMVGTSRANMTRILAELEQLGYIKRAPSARDGRRQVVTITALGRRRTQETVPQIAAPLREAFAGLSESEMTMLSRLLRRLVVSFDQGLHELRNVA